MPACALVGGGLVVVGACRRAGAVAGHLGYALVGPEVCVVSGSASPRCGLPWRIRRPIPRRHCRVPLWYRLLSEYGVTLRGRKGPGRKAPGPLSVQSGGGGGLSAVG